MSNVTAPASASIQVGGTAQVLFAAANMGYLFELFNPYVATESLFVADGAVATVNAIEVKPGGYYLSESLTTNAVSILGASAGHAFYARSFNDN